MCTEIFYCNCPIGTSLLALLAADAANLTGSHHLLALIMGAAVHNHLLIVWNQLNQVSWAFGNTFTAGLTCFFIHNSNTVYNVNRIKGTDLHAASEATAAIGAGL